LNLATYNNAFAAKTVERLESAYPEYKPADPDAWVKGAVVELARLYIPYGFFAEIVRIDTLVVDATTGQPIGAWDSPDSFDNVFKFAMGYNSIHDKSFNADDKDRFTNFTTTTADWFNICGVTPLLRFPAWEDNRFAWGNPSNEWRQPLQEGIACRLFVYCKEDTEYLHTVRGRLLAEISLKETTAAQWRAQR
jgi:hypothetical protein